MQAHSTLWAHRSPGLITPLPLPRVKSRPWCSAFASREKRQSASLSLAYTMSMMASCTCTSAPHLNLLRTRMRSDTMPRHGMRHEWSCMQPCDTCGHVSCSLQIQIRMQPCCVLHVTCSFRSRVWERLMPDGFSVLTVAARRKIDAMPVSAPESLTILAVRPSLNCLHKPTSDTCSVVSLQFMRYNCGGLSRPA